MANANAQSRIQARRKNRVGHAHKSSTRPRPEPSQAALKKRMRDLTRLLKRPEKIPADVIQTRERELAACKDELESGKRYGGASNRMISKYHMVRFFERKKATRALKKAKRRLASNEDASNTESLKQEAHNCQIDLDYTLYYPLNQKYQSLYKSSEAKGPSTQPLRDNDMWSVVEAAFQANNLEALRDGKFPSASVTADDASTDSKSRPVLFETEPLSAHELTIDNASDDHDDDNEDHDDDGGDFFEK